MAEPSLVLPTYPKTTTGWLPTIVTLTRVAFAAVMVIAFHVGSRAGYLLAAAMFVAAWTTDLVDGALARRLDMSSQVGSACDAAADRILCVAAICLLIFGGVVDMRLGLGVISRELIADSVRAWVIRAGHVAPHNVFGRLKFGCIAIATVIGLGALGELAPTRQAAFAAGVLLAVGLAFGLLSIGVVIKQGLFRHGSSRVASSSA